MLFGDIAGVRGTRERLLKTAEAFIAQNEKPLISILFPAFTMAEGIHCGYIRVCAVGRVVATEPEHISCR